MTEQEQRIAIAEFCPSIAHHDTLDLDAMHEVEAVLLEQDELWQAYQEELQGMIFPVWHANLEHRIAALLRIIGKLRD